MCAILIHGANFLILELQDLSFPLQPFLSRTCAHKANTQEQRYLAAAWPTNAMRDPRRGAATEMGRGEHATAVRETYRERLVALPHRARSPTATSAPKPDHALGRPHHRRARGFSAASRRTPREIVRTMAPMPQAYANGILQRRNAANGPCVRAPSRRSDL